MNLRAKVVVDRLLEAVIVPASSIMLPSFWSDFSRLPDSVKEAVHQKYQRWRVRPESLNFEPKFSNVYAVEITRDYHAICTVSGQHAAADVFWGSVLGYNAYRKRLDTLRKQK